MVLSFTGWNDAGEAASGALEHFLSAWSDENSSVVPELMAEIDPEEFYDFQVNRPRIFVDNSKIRKIEWPGTVIYGLATPELDRDFILVKGAEPSIRWRTFTRELLDLADDCEVSLLITLGSLLADTPHSRPISVSGSGAHPEIADRLGVEISKYEGPTGILGVIQDACMKRDIDAISLWAAVPHYASAPPSPKASLALINALEDFLSITIPATDLVERSREWESRVDELASEDSAVGEYVKELEASKDAADLPGVSGETIAREFERYLRRQSDS